MQNSRSQEVPSSFDVTSTRDSSIKFLPTSSLSPDPRNPRKHSGAQVRAIAKSIEVFGFNAPILVDKNNQIIAGHGRYEAAKLLGMTEVPVIYLDHLSEAQARAYMLADNKLTERSFWNDVELATQLRELSELAVDFDIEATGFEPPEIDFRIQSLDEPETATKADDFKLNRGPPVSQSGDLWRLDEHRILCGSALDGEAYGLLFDTDKATAVVADTPFNVPINGHVCGNGAVKHDEFIMASGELTQAEFTSFLTSSMELAVKHTVPGALLYVCMDWRHMGEILAAGTATGCKLLNLCIWVKTNGGMGSLYRSRHELVFVFKNGTASHINNVQLGRFGRNRTNVWNYAGANSFARRGQKRNLELHPTVKPIGMVMDAISDSTNRGDIVLDPFLGSGTTLLAAERSGRRCYGIEIDPRYTDTAISRWQKMTGNEARHSSGMTYADVKAERDKYHDEKTQKSSKTKKRR